MKTLKLHISKSRLCNFKFILVFLASFFILNLTLYLFNVFDIWETNLRFIQSTITRDHRFRNKFVDGRVIFKESRRAHRLLDGKFGLEIGTSTHNPYGLLTLNVDYTDGSTVFNRYGPKIPVTKVDIVASGDDLPFFTNNSLDFVISSHVIEHFWDPIKAIKEWLRIVKQDGYVYMDIPHKCRTFDSFRNRTALAELLQRHNGTIPFDPTPAHHTVWITEDVLELADHFNWTVAEWSDQDDKTAFWSGKSIGFTVVLQKLNETGS